MVTAIMVCVALGACAPGDTTQDVGDAYDYDQDGMSDAVEVESHNVQLYGLNANQFNLDPSRAFGTRDNGTLSNGLNLPDTGELYIHQLGTDLKDTDDWAAGSMLSVLELAARSQRGYADVNGYPCYPNTPGRTSGMPRMQVNDLSLQFGGVFGSPREHSEHQNGLDADIRYLRFSGEQRLDLADPVDRQNNYDVVSTLELIQCFLNDSRVIQILYDSEYSNIVPGQGESKLINRHQQRDHTDHFHVRIADPDGSNN
jgi:hypothetical protein